MRLRNDTAHAVLAMTDPPQLIEPGEAIDHDVETFGVIAGLTEVPDDEPEPAADDGDDDEQDAESDAPAGKPDTKPRRGSKPADTAEEATK